MKKDLLEQFRSGLKIDRYDLDREIAEQSEAFYRVAEEAVLAVSRRDEAKSDMDAAFSDASSRARRKGAGGGKGEGKDRTTEAQIKETANKDEDYTEAVDAYLTAKKRSDQLQGMREAYEMRGKMLRELAQLYIAGYFQLTAVGGKTQRKTDQAAAREAREIVESHRQSFRPRRSS